MTDIKNLTRPVLLTCLLLTGAKCKESATFVYSRLGGDVLLPCKNLVSPNCSLISWTFFQDDQVRFTEEVRKGQVWAGSNKSSRLSVTSNCSLSIHDLRVHDAGSYNCVNDEIAIAEVYLSLLTITSFSTITDLQPGGDLTLNCILFTYYYAGNCISRSSVFNLSWVAEDTKDSRYELIGHSHCNITLVINLQREDNNKKWRCQVSTNKDSRAMFLDFTSTFLFESPSTAQNLIPSGTTDCPAHLPISRIMLCVALPVMVIVVEFLRRDCKRARKSAADIELQEIN